MSEASKAKWDARAARFCRTVSRKSYSRMSIAERAQVASIILMRLTKGDTDEVIAKRHGLTLPTVRKAMCLLVRQGETRRLDQ